LTELKEGEGTPGQESVERNIVDPIVKEHERLIRQFPNPSKGLEMNREAVELAKIDPSEIDDVIEYIKFRKERALKNTWLPKNIKKEDPEENNKTGTGEA
jgi:hypothetical protein